MQQKYFIRFTFILLIMSLLGCGIFAEDNNDIIDEVISNILIGGTLAICEYYVWCHMLLFSVTIIFIIISVVIFISTGKCLCKAPSGKDFRRGATVYSGYKLFGNNS